MRGAAGVSRHSAHEMACWAALRRPPDLRRLALTQRRHENAPVDSPESQGAVRACSDDFLPASPPGEKATASQDQARQASTDDGAGHRCKSKVV
jgi:hypothetical protein